MTVLTCQSMLRIFPRGQYLLSYKILKHFEVFNLKPKKPSLTTVGHLCFLLTRDRAAQDISYKPFYFPGTFTNTKRPGTNTNTGFENYKCSLDILFKPFLFPIIRMYLFYLCVFQRRQMQKNLIFNSTHFRALVNENLLFRQMVSHLVRLKYIIWNNPRPP